MVGTLASFLMTGKNKRVAVQRQACEVLGLETKGIADVIRRRLINFADDDEKDLRVRTLIRAALEAEEKAEENANDPSQPSQPSLFSQNQDNVREENRQNGDNEDAEDNEDGDEEEEGEDEDEDSTKDVEHQRQHRVLSLKK